MRPNKEIIFPARKAKQSNLDLAKRPKYDSSSKNAGNQMTRKGRFGIIQNSKNWETNFVKPAFDRFQNRNQRRDIQTNENFKDSGNFTGNSEGFGTKVQKQGAIKWQKKQTDESSPEFKRIQNNPNLNQQSSDFPTFEPNKGPKSSADQEMAYTPNVVPYRHQNPEKISLQIILKTPHKSLQKNRSNPTPNQTGSKYHKSMKQFYPKSKVSNRNIESIKDQSFESQYPKVRHNSSQEFDSEEPNSRQKKRYQKYKTNLVFHQSKEIRTCKLYSDVVSSETVFVQVSQQNDAANLNRQENQNQNQNKNKNQDQNIWGQLDFKDYAKQENLESVRQEGGQPSPNHHESGPNIGTSMSPYVDPKTFNHIININNNNHHRDRHLVNKFTNIRTNHPVKTFSIPVKQYSQGQTRKQTKSHEPYILKTTIYQKIKKLLIEKDNLFSKFEALKILRENNILKQIEEKSNYLTTKLNIGFDTKYLNSYSLNETIKDNILDFSDLFNSPQNASIELWRQQIYAWVVNFLSSKLIFNRAKKESNEIDNQPDFVKIMARFQVIFDSLCMVLDLKNLAWGKHIKSGEYPFYYQFVTKGNGLKDLFEEKRVKWEILKNKEIHHNKTLERTKSNTFLTNQPNHQLLNIQHNDSKRSNINNQMFQDIDLYTKSYLQHLNLHSLKYNSLNLLACACLKQALVLELNFEQHFLIHEILFKKNSFKQHFNQYINPNNLYKALQLMLILTNGKFKAPSHLDFVDSIFYKIGGCGNNTVRFELDFDVDKIRFDSEEKCYEAFSLRQKFVNQTTTKSGNPGKPQGLIQNNIPRHKNHKNKSFQMSFGQKIRKLFCQNQDSIGQMKRFSQLDLKKHLEMIDNHQGFKPLWNRVKLLSHFYYILMIVSRDRILDLFENSAWALIIFTLQKIIAQPPKFFLFLTKTKNLDQQIGQRARSPDFYKSEKSDHFLTMDLSKDGHLTDLPQVAVKQMIKLEQRIRREESFDETGLFTIVCQDNAPSLVTLYTLKIQERQFNT